MTKKKKKILIIALLLGGVLYNQHYYTGSRSGKVVDAETGKPIEGAVVCMEWFTGGFMGVVGGSGAAFYETKTDEKGRYKVPSLRFHRNMWFEGVLDEDVMIYKDGHSGYRVMLRPVGISFASGSADQPYRKKRNLVRLFHFKESDSHRKHYYWIEKFGFYGWPEKLLEKELQNEIERAGLKSK